MTTLSEISLIVGIVLTVFGALITVAGAGGFVRTVTLKQTIEALERLLKAKSETELLVSHEKDEKDVIISKLQSRVTEMEGDMKELHRLVAQQAVKIAHLETELEKERKRG